MNKRELIDYIKKVFNGVPQPTSMTLHEAEAADDYQSGPEFRAKDFIGPWQLVPKEHLAKCNCALSYLTDVGMRFYLPAFMVWYLEYNESHELSYDSTLFALKPHLNSDLNEYHNERFSLFNDLQLNACALFVKYCSEDETDDNNEFAKDLYETYWHQFILDEKRFVKKLRGQKRYYRSLEVKNIFKNEESLDFSKNTDGWSDLCHWHFDFHGLGNTSFKKRKPHLDMLFRHFEILEEKLKTIRMEFQAFAIIHDFDSYDDALYLHTPNPNHDDFPVTLLNLVNTNTLKNKELIDYLDQLNGYEKLYSNGEEACCFLYKKGVGVELSSSLLIK